MDTLGNKIRNLRKEKGISQEELAFVLDSTRQTVSKWELGSMQPTIDNLKSLCAYFNVDANYFVGDNETVAVAETEGNRTESTEPISVAANENKAPSKFKMVKLISFVVACVLLTFCIIACAIAGYVTIAPDKGQYVMTTEKVNYAGIISIVIGVVALAVLVTLLAVYIKNRRKK